jgi:hypothetical protein
LTGECLEVVDDARCTLRIQPGGWLIGEQDLGPRSKFNTNLINPTVSFNGRDRERS